MPEAGPDVLTVVTCLQTCANLANRQRGSGLARIFLSHSSKNNVQAMAVTDWLAANGWGREDIFLDIDPVSGIAPGERWQRTLNEAAGRCEAVLFLISPDWLASRWCLEELALAHKLNKRLFGIIVAPVEYSEIPGRLRDEWQLVDLESPRDAIMLDVEMPNGQQGYATFSESGLARLRAGLLRAGLDPRFFAWPPANDPNRPPYRGLMPLEAEDAGIFFGREASTIAALDLMRGLTEAPPPRMISILGASGAGKSSFLRAGLIPRLKRDNYHFHVLPIVRPERDALTGKSGFVSALTNAAEELRLKWTRAAVLKVMADAHEAARLVAEIAAAVEVPLKDTDSGRPPAIILPIDQAEELFIAEGADESKRLIELLAELVRREQPLLIPIATIRTDSYEPLQQALAQLEIKDTPFSLPALARGAYQRVIEGPAERLAGTRRELKIEPALVAALLTDIEEGGAKDALPLLAFTLERIFRDHGGDGDLTRAEYVESGRIAGAIEAAVERALLASDSDVRVPRDRTAKLALLRRAMIPWLAGIDPETKSARRQVARYSDIPDEARPLIDHFVSQRLLATDVSPITGERTIEPAHEAVLRQWGLIDRWLKEDIAVLATLENVRRAARDWDANRRAPAWLVHSGGRLEEAEAIKSRIDLKRRLDPTDLEYLDSARAAETARRDRELNEARALAEERKRVTDRTRIGAVAASLLAIVAGVAAWYAFSQAERAASSARLALKNETVSTSVLSNVALSEGLPGEAMKLALAAWPRPSDPERPQLRSTLSALSAATAQHFELERFAFPGARVLALLFGSTGAPASDALVVVANGQNAIQILGASSARPVLDLSGEFGPISEVAIAISSEHRLLAAAAWNKTARIWNLRDGRILHTLLGHTDAVTSVALSSDGTRIVTGSADGTAIIWDVQGGTQLRVLKGHKAGLTSVLFFNDDTQILTTSQDNTARVWDAQTGANQITMASFADYPLAATASASKMLYPANRDQIPYSEYVVVSSIDGALSRFRLPLPRGAQPDIGRPSPSENGDGATLVAPIDKLNLAPGKIGSVLRYSPSGSLLAVGAWDGSVTLFDAATLRPLRTLSRHLHAVRDVLFAEEDSRVVSAGSDGTVRIWDAGLTQADAGSTGPSVIADGPRIEPYDGSGVASITDAALEEQTRSLQSACAKLGQDLDLETVQKRYGLRQLAPICGANIPAKIDPKALE